MSSTEQTSVILKVLLYAGIVIRDPQIVQAASQQIQQEEINQKVNKLGLITETNEQYYAGSQKFLAATALGGQAFTTTFDTELVFGGTTAWNPLDTNYALNNFKIYTAAPGVLTYTEYINAFTVVGNTITITAAVALTQV